MSLILLIYLITLVFGQMDLFCFVFSFFFFFFFPPFFTLLFCMIQKLRHIPIFCRSGLLNGSSKFDGPSLPASSNGRATPKNELEKVSLSRDSVPGLSKERFKGNNKYVILLNICYRYLSVNVYLLIDGPFDVCSFSAL